MKVNTIFITGATGNIGAKLVARILADDSSCHVVLLVRGLSPMDAENRVEDVLRIVSPEIDYALERKRITVICGDITKKQLGLTESTYTSLASRVTHIIHSAAATQFNLPLKRSREINFCGTKNVMTFAKLAKQIGHLQRVAHISTAYVCGDVEGTIYEDELISGQRFSNSYEQSKWETEQYVRKLMEDLPIAIFRPSIVVGDSRTGRIIKFNVLYMPLRYVWRGIVRVIPCSPNTTVDVVPLDFAANAIHHIFLHYDSPLGKTFNIVAGKENVSTIGSITNEAIDYFNAVVGHNQIVSVRFLPPTLCKIATSLIHRKVNKLVELLKIFEPYMCRNRIFDNTNTKKALQGTGIIPLPLCSYLCNILQQCIETNWGRKLRQAA